MRNILLFVGKLRAFAGWRLYLGYAGMIAISLFEGVGIYLLVPMLGLIGILDFEVRDIPVLSNLVGQLRALPEPYALPAVLAAYIGVMAVQALLQRAHAVLQIRIQQGFVRSLRVELYEALIRANWSFYLRSRRSDFNHALTSELARASQGTYLTLQLSASLLFTAIQLGFAFWLSPELTLLVLACGALLAFFSRKFVRSARSIGQDTTELSQAYFAGIAEHFGGIKDLKSNGLETAHLNRFRALCRRMEDNIVRFTKLQSATQFMYKIASALLVGLFVYVAFAWLHVQPGHLILIVFIFARLWPRFSAIQTSAEQLVSAIPAFNGLIELKRRCEEAREALPDRGEGEATIAIRQGVECRDVSYRYGSEGDYALRNVNLFIPANRMTAIVGKSGAGKSTLIDLLMGLIEPDSGRIEVDGESYAGARAAALRRSVSYVAQDPYLFHATIRENLLLVAPGESEERLWEALRQAAADDFVRNLPDGLDTVIGDRGIRLSGGERQRIVLARALMRKPSVLVLDEATSALDAENEAHIAETLERLKGSMTIIVIAHRFSTIRHADRVVVLERGEVVQQGELRQLARETAGTFSRWMANQHLLAE